MDIKSLSSGADHDAQRPAKRARHGTPPAESNGHEQHFEMPPLSLSILGVEPMDEFIREVADFVHHTIMNRPDRGGVVEVEAKIGVLREKASGQRLVFPVLVETILSPNSFDTRFESNMSPAQHKHFNKLLNELKLKSSQPGHPSSPLEYTHLHLIDNFYASDDPQDREKIRVTRHEKSGEVVAVMRKVRLGSIDIYCPKRHADWRISVNMEIPVPPPLGSPTLTRKKDRMSYTHEEFTIDLTQVTSATGPNSKPEILHELEVEFARPDYLLATAAKRGDLNASEVERSAFDELIRAFVNNARILVRNADGVWQ
ncbi:uncharacterized protein PHACADRAFT_261863 [Phanerochaete carnosa HHB-10118-sp]|uniref:mRNA-capping enzyme subunit beta n=1 Tax=Phanerochaete carnosa (strain HHB-10118-sp) TaxID=650164 RepID=K5WMS0_PHACS|nr:uncharacterized protein PHACADRAFT_261863 [Phanerochaete carnosa HHB-10118-sp]EKM51617.1 hypothetical protein PHACADRAFT_261863 [Phanerochaete carnosa HHB-10118-sp]